ncbi:MAG: helix-turn-helix transcriptional regulator [Gemmatimonadota bacterium]|nr:MAG: helix-turn-helix transcriptional regulator [Gemmatimonadota bacterium]
MSDEKMSESTDEVIEQLLSQKLEAESARIYIRCYYGKMVSAHDVADALGLGYHCLRKKFKNKTGQSIGHFLIQTKLEGAKELFQKTNLSVKEVSFEVGFRDPSHFSKMFKKYVGVPPLEYKTNKDDSQHEHLN